MLPVWMALLLAPVVAIELALTGADLGLWGSPVWRSLATALLAADGSVLRGAAPPDWPGQGLAMVVSYAFLHGGPLHMATNAPVLLLGGRLVAERTGLLRTVLLFLAAAIGGAIAFALLGPADATMAGASASGFGFLGFLVVAVARERRARRRRVLPVLLIVPAMAAGDLLLNLALDGRLASEAHLGGFLTGALFAALWRPVSGGGRRRL
jgi:membrane associated rhomboid family serine protease